MQNMLSLKMSEMESVKTVGKPKELNRNHD